MPIDRCEVLVVGAGPAGAVSALALARHGLDVVCLEQGSAVDDAALDRDGADWPRRKAREWSANPNVRDRAVDDPVDDADSDIRPMFFHGVGGSTVLWTAHVPRFKPSDFRVRSTDGVADDWPIGYDDLAPFYDRVEAELGVALKPGDPLSPPRSGDHRPPLPIGASGRAVAAALDRLGWHWWPVDRVVGARGTAPCTHDGPCDFGCATGRAAAADRILWPRAIAAGARLLTEARVLEIEEGGGRVRGVVWQDRDGVRRRIAADVVIVAANGIGTPKLLLQSASGAFPHGLGNRSGLVGRNLMLHAYAGTYAVFPEPFGPTDPEPTGGIISHEFYDSVPERGFVRGSKLQLIASARSLPVAVGEVPGANLAGRDLSDRVAGFTVCGEDLPEPENRVTLSDRLTDRAGRPAARMIYRLSDNSRRLLDFGLARAEEALREAGASEIHHVPLRTHTGFHLMGTARMGADPETSVVDPFGRVHDLANLHVADSSVFVTGAAVNPTNTAMALALRQAEHIAATRRTG